MERAWYFAYGSNLHVEVFRGRRGIAHHRAVPGRLAGWRLVFDKPPLFPIGESFANLVEDAGATAVGVLYEIDAGELQHIDLTEGVQIGNYARIEVEVATLGPPVGIGAAVSAHTLVSEKRDDTLCPSHRYMELVIEGARAHGLPDEHIAALRQVPSRPSTPEALAAQKQIDDILRRLR